MFPSACRRLYVCVSKILFCICLSGGGEASSWSKHRPLPQTLSWVAAAWMPRHCPQILYEYTRTHNFLDGFGRLGDPLEFYLVSSWVYCILGQEPWVSFLMQLPLRNPRPGYCGGIWTVVCIEEGVCVCSLAQL